MEPNLPEIAEIPRGAATIDAPRPVGLSATGKTKNAFPQSDPEARSEPMARLYQKSLIVSLPAFVPRAPQTP